MIHTLAGVPTLKIGRELYSGVRHLYIEDYRI